MPLEIARYDDPFLPYSKAVIDAVRDRICVVIFDLAAYLAVGAAGAVALERAIAFARSDGTTCVVVHAPFASDAFAQSMSEAAFAADAVTVNDESVRSGFAAAHVGAYLTGQTQTGSSAVYHEAEALLRHAQMPHLDVRLVSQAFVRSARREDFTLVIRTEVERLNIPPENRSED
jgi:maltooligosyltrehalose synthase